MKENNRCSTLFHLLVPGGKSQTLSASPVWSARRCNSHFQSRRRQPLLPPPSTVISSRCAGRYRPRPSPRPQPRIAATADPPLSASVHTFAEPTVRPLQKLP